MSIIRMSHPWEQPQLEKFDYHEFHKFVAQGNFDATYTEMLRLGSDFEMYIQDMESDLQNMLSPEELEAVEECLDEDGKKMLTLLWAYDPVVLFPHSIRTFQIGFGKFKRPLSIDGIPLRFFDTIVLRAIGMNVLSSKSLFFEALLLHDIGKLDIPASIIDNSVTDEESITYVARLPIKESMSILRKVSPKQEEPMWGENFEAMSLEERKQAIRMALDGNRMNKFMPMHFLVHIEHWNKKRKESEEHGLRFDDDIVQSKYSEDRDEEEQLRSSNFSPEQTLGEILPLHEEHSKRILEKHGLYIPAIIAGNHHTLNGDATPEMRALFTMIQFCDELEAMTAKRQYNPSGRPRLQALSMIVEEAHKMPEKFTIPILALCIEDEVLQMLPSEWRDVDESFDGFRGFEIWAQSPDISSKEREWRLNIVQFLDENREIIIDKLHSSVS